MSLLPNKQVPPPGQLSHPKKKKSISDLIVTGLIWSTVVALAYMTWTIKGVQFEQSNETTPSQASNVSVPQPIEHYGAPTGRIANSNGEITREQLGNDWPFTVDNGEVDCTQINGKRILTFEARDSNGKYWKVALNGNAMLAGFPHYKDTPIGDIHKDSTAVEKIAADYCKAKYGF